MGDFNCVLNAAERVGGNSTQLGTDHFRACVGDCGILDIQSVGALYTWNNKQRNEDRVYSKLDRVLINKDWSDHFTDAFAHFLPEGLSDHTPCIVNFQHIAHHSRSFIYVNMWGLSERFIPTIRRVWNKEEEGTPMFKVVKKLKTLKIALKELNNDRFSDVEQKTTAMEIRVKHLQEELGMNPSDISLSEEECRVRHEYQILKEARDSFLAQKSKQVWRQEGDQNTAYFHGVIRGRSQINKVLEIEDVRGKECVNPTEIQAAFLDYYTTLLGESQSTTKVHRSIMNCGMRCTADIFNALLVPITRKEIKEALFSIPDIKSPGPDGYTSKFYKDAWVEIGGEVIAVVKDFFKHKKLLKQLNATTLVMIPKCQRPTSVFHFKPIACCNVLYKVISKLLCDRLANVLPHLIDQNQGAFIMNRSIQENILIC
ncbi:hypothetical protein vseg_008006 [Gypsophila vaccaria]